MNIIKKWWLWYWIAVVILSIIYFYPFLKINLVFFISLFLVPFCIINLIINGVKHNKKKTSMGKDWKFWFWLVFFIILLFIDWVLFLISRIYID